MEGDPKIDVQKMIDDINKRNVDSLLKGKKENKGDELSFDKKKEDEPKEATIIQIGKVSKEDIEQIVSETELSALKLFKGEIKILILSIETGQTVKTIDALDEILKKHSDLKKYLKSYLKDVLIEEILEKETFLLKNKNNKELLHKLDALKAILEHFFKNDLK